MNFTFDKSKDDLIADIGSEFTSKVRRDDDAPTRGYFGRYVTHVAFIHSLDNYAGIIPISIKIVIAYTRITSVVAAKLTNCAILTGEILEQRDQATREPKYCIRGRPLESDLIEPIVKMAPTAKSSS